MRLALLIASLAGGAVMALAKSKGKVDKSSKLMRVQRARNADGVRATWARDQKSRTAKERDLHLVSAPGDRSFLKGRF
jgi:hypothetical protein